VNCIPNADNIGIGDELFVPRLPGQPVGQNNRAVPNQELIASLMAEGCTSQDIQITSPLRGQQLSSTFNVRGTAQHDDFDFYQLELRPDFAESYNFYSRSEVPVRRGVLGEINTELFDPGLYWLRLSVVDSRGEFTEPCAIPLIFR
jgi:hypothetical protein